MKKIILWIVLLAAVAAIGVWLLKGQSAVKQPMATQASKMDLANELLLTGAVVNDQMVTITALLDGQIADINAREGDVIKGGDTLAQLDSQLSEALLGKARAEQAYKQQELASLKVNASRLQKLFNSKSVSRQAYDEAITAVQRAEAAVQVARADAKVASINVSNATVKAPFDAIVTRQRAEVGQWVEAGTSLFTLVGTTGRVIEAYVDAGDLSSVSIGQKVSLKTNAYPDLTWESELNWIAPVVGQSDSNNAPTNSFAIRFPMGEDAPKMLLGQLIDVTLETERKDQVLALPLALLNSDASGQFSVWVEASGKAERRDVKVGLLTIDHAEILDGLAEGDWVLSSQGVSLQEGEPVEPILSGSQ